MNIIRSKTYLSGFWTHDLGDLSNELAIVGEGWVMPGFVLNPDSHPDWEFKLLVEGKMEWNIDGQPYTMTKGMMYVIGPGTHHVPEPVKEPTHFIFIRVNYHEVLKRCREIYASWMDKPVVMVKDALPLQTVLQSIVRGAVTQGLHRKSITQNYINIFTMELTRLLANDMLINPVGVCKHKGIARLVLQMEERYEDKWTLREMADIANVSYKYISQCFKNEMNITPMQYLIKLKIDGAKKRLIHTDNSITQIAMDLGFSSTQHFSTQFSAITHMTPSEFRKKHH